MNTDISFFSVEPSDHFSFSDPSDPSNTHEDSTGKLSLVSALLCGDRYV